MQLHSNVVQEAQAGEQKRQNSIDLASKGERSIKSRSFCGRIRIQIVANTKPVPNPGRCKQNHSHIPQGC